MDESLIIIITLSVILILLLSFALLFSRSKSKFLETAEKRAGRLGERFATQIISEILLPDDELFTNVKVSFDGNQTELDNIIINSRGVFIIEVKNYSGVLIGDEDDFEWIKNKYTPGGNFYQKTVKNPIKQVNRQIYILSRFLKNYGINVWIEGYAFFVENNSPVKNEQVLQSQEDIDYVLHQGTN
nr:NERD domain-containing protein [Lachnospiraceae bacterium]